MFLSIIVPCYNVEQYVEKCIDSIENQDIPKDDYEVLAYNDGSTDTTLDVLLKLADKYANLKIASHKNIGLSGTRNRGIREAHGDFIWFIDSDDWIESNCLGKILASINNETDIVAFSGFIPEGDRSAGADIYGDNVTDKQTLFTYGFADGAPFYMHRRDFLIENNLFFKEGIKHEDTLFTPIVLNEAREIVFYRTPVYHYLLRSGSITTVKDLKRIYDLNNNMSYLLGYADKIKDLVVKRGFLTHIAHHIIEMLNYGIDNGEEGEKLIEKIMREHPHYWQIMKNAIDLKPQLIYWAVKLSPLPFVMTYKLLLKLNRYGNKTNS